jgi:hypothetical protein
VALAGTVAWCPSCRQKFRLPSVETSPPLERPSQRPAAEDTPTKLDDARVQPLPGSKRPTPVRPAKAIDDDRDTAEPQEPTRVQEVEMEEPKKKPGSDDPVLPKFKKRKKKKNKGDDLERRALHIALVGVGVFVVVALTLGVFLIQRGATSKEKFDPLVVIAEIEQYGGRVERDTTLPDRPVIGVDLGGVTYRAAVLNKLVAFPQLRKLNLSGETTTDVFLEHLHDVTTLRSLNLSHTRVTMGGIQFLTKMVEMEDLDLTQTLGVNDHTLEQLKGMTKLKRIHLDGTFASGYGLKETAPDLEIIK